MQPNSKLAEANNEAVFRSCLHFERFLILGLNGSVKKISSAFSIMCGYSEIDYVLPFRLFILFIPKKETELN